MIQHGCDIFRRGIVIKVWDAVPGGDAVTATTVSLKLMPNVTLCIVYYQYIMFMIRHSETTTYPPSFEHRTRGEITLLWQTLRWEISKMRYRRHVRQWMRPRWSPRHPRPQYRITCMRGHLLSDARICLYIHTVTFVLCKYSKISGNNHITIHFIGHCHSGSGFFIKSGVPL